jgi:hypothetical protein
MRISSLCSPVKMKERPCLERNKNNAIKIEERLIEGGRQREKNDRYKSNEGENMIKEHYLYV